MKRVLSNPLARQQLSDIMSSENEQKFIELDGKKYIVKFGPEIKVK